MLGIYRFLILVSILVSQLGFVGTIIEIVSAAIAALLSRKEGL